MQQESHCIYRQGQSGEVSVLSIDSAREQYDSLLQRGMSTAAARDIVQAGGLWCSHGGRMVPVFGTARVDHFRHLVDTTRQATTETGGGGGCGCTSDAHVNAQLLLQRCNFGTTTLIITQFADCRRCCAEVYRSTPTTRAAVEVHEVSDAGRRFVSDVVLYDGNTLTARIEVYKTHRACAQRRAGCPFYEVRADHIVSAMCETAPIITLKAESDDCALGPCSICPPANERNAPYWLRRLRKDLAVVHTHFRRLGYAHKESVAQWRDVLPSGLTDAQIYGIVNVRYKDRYLTWRTMVAMARNDVRAVEELVQHGAYVRTLVTSDNPDILAIVARHGAAKDMVHAAAENGVAAMHVLRNAGVPFTNKRGRSEALEEAIMHHAHDAVRVLEQWLQL